MYSARAIFSKLAILALLSAVALPLLTDVTVTTAVVFGIILAAGLYLIGDVLVLNYMGNAVATIVDAGTAMIAARYLGAYLPNVQVSWTDAAIFGAIVGIAEYFFHSYLNSAETSDGKNEIKPRD